MLIKSSSCRQGSCSKTGRQKRNREVIISYIEKTFNEDIKNIYEHFVSEEHVSLLVTFEEILHKKLELYLQISESIAIN